MKTPFVETRILSIVRSQMKLIESVVRIRIPTALS